MTALTQVLVRQVAFGFGAGALFMALATPVGSALAQSPAPVALDMHQMFEWCRQMMGQAGSMMQGMMSGMCMMGR